MIISYILYLISYRIENYIYDSIIYHYKMVNKKNNKNSGHIVENGKTTICLDRTAKQKLESIKDKNKLADMNSTIKYLLKNQKR